jgi:hypothetical protein
MLNMHKQFEHKHTVVAGQEGKDLTVELGFTPSHIEVYNEDNDVKTIFKTGMPVKSIDAAGDVTDDTDGIVLYAGGTSIGYDDGSVPSYKDAAGTTVEDYQRIDPEGTKVVGAHLPKLNTTNELGTYDNYNKYISKPGFTIDSDLYGSGEVIFITAIR